MPPVLISLCRCIHSGVSSGSLFLLSAAAKDVLASVFGIAARGGLVRARVRVGVSAGAGGAGSTPEAGAFASVIATSQSRDSGVPL